MPVVRRWKRFVCPEITRARSLNYVVLLSSLLIRPNLSRGSLRTPAERFSCFRFSLSSFRLFSLNAYSSGSPVRFTRPLRRSLSRCYLIEFENQGRGRDRWWLCDNNWHWYLQLHCVLIKNYLTKISLWADLREITWREQLNRKIRGKIFIGFSKGPESTYRSLVPNYVSYSYRSPVTNRLNR